MGVLAGTQQCATDAQAGWHREQSANPVHAVRASLVSDLKRVCELVQTNCDARVL